MGKKINSINLTHLTNGAHYQFLTYALERLEALAPTVKTRFAADVTAFENALANENEFLVVSQKSMLTDDISLADQQRDAFYIGYKGLVKSFLNVSEGELLNAAKVLWQHLTDYGINTRMQFDRETGLLANMLEDLTGKYSEQVELLGAKGIVDRIKEANDKVAWVNYPDLEDNKYHDLAKKYLPNGSCGVLSFGLKGGRDVAIRFMDNLKLAAIVTHVADARTCVLHPASHTHRQLTDEQLIEAGIAPDLIRFSVGIENVEDIIADIQQALEA